VYPKGDELHSGACDIFQPQFGKFRQPHLHLPISGGRLRLSAHTSSANHLQAEPERVLLLQSRGKAVNAGQLDSDHLSRRAEDCREAVGSIPFPEARICTALYRRFITLPYYSLQSLFRLGLMSMIRSRFVCYFISYRANAFSMNDRGTSSLLGPPLYPRTSIAIESRHPWETRLKRPLPRCLSARMSGKGATWNHEGVSQSQERASPRRRDRTRGTEVCALSDLLPCLVEGLPHTTNRE